MNDSQRRSAAGFAAAIAIATALLVVGGNSTLRSLLPHGAGTHSLGAASTELVSAVHEETSRLSHDAPSAASYQLAQYMIDVAPHATVAEFTTHMCPDQYMIDCQIR